MAHWIIEDKGFGGQVYTCSNCKECLSDLYHRPYMWNACKNCGELIEENKEEYVENIKDTLKETEQNITKLFDLMTDKNNPIWLWLPDNAAILQFAKYLNDNNVKVLDNGEWGKCYKENVVICSICKEEHYLGTYHQYVRNYCSNCGARMKDK